MCSENNTGSGEGRGPWGGKGPSDAQITRGWKATPKERREHSKGYGDKPSRKEEKRFFEW